MGLFKRMMSDHIYGKRGDFPHVGPDVLTAADLQTARDNGINSIRGAKKNMGALRQIQQSQRLSQMDPFGDNPPPTAANAQLSKAREKEQFGIKAKVKKSIAETKPTSLPSLGKSMLGNHDV